MISAWTKHIEDPDKKQKFADKVQASKVILERISELMSEDLAAVEKEEINVSAYDNPNWAYRQAHRNGYKNAIRKLNLLLDLKDTTNGRQPT